MEQKENLEENVASLQTEVLILGALILWKHDHFKMNQRSEEVKMAQEENERLKELVVNDPEQWEKTFLKIRNDINEAKKDTKELKALLNNIFHEWESNYEINYSNRNQ